MTTEIITEKDLCKTSDLALAAVIFLSYPLEAVDKKNPRKAEFLFRRENGLDELVEGYWREALQVEPQAYFNALRTIKARLYGEE